MENVNNPQPAPMKAKKSSLISALSFCLAILGVVLLFVLRPSADGLEMTMDGVNKFISQTETAAFVGIGVSLAALVLGIVGCIKSTKGFAIAGIVIALIGLLLSFANYPTTEEREKLTSLMESVESLKSSLGDLGDFATDAAEDAE